MIKLYIAYDSEDVPLGKFFAECASAVKKGISSIQDNFSIEEITPASDSTKVAFFTNTIKHETYLPFILLAFMHGNENNFILDQCNFISTKNDNTSLQKTYIYTNACSSANELGPALIQTGAYTFIGPTRDVPMLHKHYDFFSNCHTYPLLQFLLGVESSFNSFRNRRAYHLDQVNKLRIVDRFAAGILRDQLEIFVCLGESKLIADFQVND